MGKIHILSFLSIVLLSLVAPVVALADAIGSWNLYPCYNNVTDIQPAGDNIYVLASGNLYSYNNHDTSLQEYNKLTGLSDNNIINIAWVQSAKALVIVYSDCCIDLLYNNGEVTCIKDYADKTMTGTKTVNDIYVNGQYAYLSTGFGIIKIDVKNEYIADTYNLGYRVNYCYISDGLIYLASPTHGIRCADLTANLRDKNNWSGVRDYTDKTKDQYVYDSHNNCYWAADADSKLTKYQKQDDGTFIAISTGVKPDGPSTDYWWRVTLDNGVIYCSDGAYSVETGGGNLHPGNVKTYDGTNWSVIENNDITTSAAVTYKGSQCVLVDPFDSNHIFVGAYSGLYECQNDKYIKYYDRASYAEKDGSKYQNMITSMCFDSEGSLWLVSNISPYISKLSKSGEWSKYNHSDLLTSNYNCANEGMIVDSRGLIWFCSTRYENGRVFCYNPKTDVLKRFDNFVNQDSTKYAENYMRSLAEDNLGNVWIASRFGPFYFSASDIANGKGVMTQYKVPRNDGTNLADYLLSDIDIQCIAVDNANRKWMGTARNGVYVISSDCNTQEHHFTSDNSPLPSNDVTDIKIDDSTGKVYIVAGNGLCSYQSDVTDENETMSKETVWAYPNPVTPEYTGMITITGLVSGTQLKITTASGQLVHSATCSGGSYQWNGCDLSGNKVASGVYMVNIATAEGEKGCVTKIAIVR